LGVEELKDGKIKEKVEGIKLRPVQKQLKIDITETWGKTEPTCANTMLLDTT
jgi:hypothetical protein